MGLYREEIDIFRVLLVGSQTLIAATSNYPEPDRQTETAWKNPCGWARVCVLREQTYMVPICELLCNSWILLQPSPVL